MKLENKLKSYFLSSKLSFMRVIPFNSLVFDDRAPYTCKYGCKNYNRKYSCPPHSLNLSKQIRLGEFKQAIVFATTYDLPADYSWYKRRCINIQKEWEIQRIVSEIGQIAKESKMQFQMLSGGSCKRCKECSLINDKPCKKPHLKQVSMEAVSIDCQKTMHKAGFDFQMPQGNTINRCGCLLIKDKIDYFELKKQESFEKYRIRTQNEVHRLCQKLIKNNPELYKKIVVIPVDKLKRNVSYCSRTCPKYGKNFSCPPYSDEINLTLWKTAIIWQWNQNDLKKSNYNQALKKLHSSFFSLGHYFALSLRDCYCDACPACPFSLTEKVICDNRSILSPSIQSQGINLSSFGRGKFGIELL